MRLPGFGTWAPLGSMALMLSCVMLPTLAVSAVNAADAKGCQGEATSFDAVGIPMDNAAAPGAGGTREDPLDVLWVGTIEWSGSTAEVLQNGTYKVGVAPTRGGILIETLVGGVTSRLPGFSGDVKNADGKQTAEGVVSPSELTGMSKFMTGMYAVDWTVTGEAGSCTGSGFVKITDNPRGSTAWWVALAFILLGLFGIIGAIPKAKPVKG
jgi:hypothetical protein